MKTPEYVVWQGMIQRCTNPASPWFHYYGGRGIRVCDRWRRSFASFLADMGRRPSPMLTLDRIDNNGHYCPENCRWATRTEQMRNRTSYNRVLTLNGESLCQEAWAERLGLNAQTIQKRLKSGWSIEKSLCTPRLRPSKRYPRKKKEVVA